MKPSRKPASMKGKWSMRPACLSAHSHASALYGVGGECFLSSRAVTGTVGEGTTTRAHMHVVVLLVASTLLLPEATQRDSPFSGTQSLVDSFGVGVVLIVPGVSGWALNNWHGVLTPAKADCADGEWT